MEAVPAPASRMRLYVSESPSALARDGLAAVVGSALVDRMGLQAQTSYVDGIAAYGRAPNRGLRAHVRQFEKTPSH